MLPFLIPVFIATTGYGVKKGLDAKEKIEKARSIVKKSKKRLKKKEKWLREEGDALNKYLEDFALYKLNIFNTQIKSLVELIQKCKTTASSVLVNDKVIFTPEEVKTLKASVDTSLEISSGLAKGITSGALTAFGAYSSVGLLATASTGTAIASLSGAAATNATLAWLGGGSLAAGGFGITGGMIALGGIVTAPAIAITGLVMDSKAEKSLTQAKEFKANVDIAIEKIERAIDIFGSVKKRVDELSIVIAKITNRYNKEFKELQNKSNICQQQEKIKSVLLLGKYLKNALEISILDKEGNLDKNFPGKIKHIKQEAKIS